MNLTELCLDPCTHENLSRKSYNVATLKKNGTKPKEAPEKTETWDKRGEREKKRLGDKPFKKKEKKRQGTSGHRLSLVQSPSALKGHFQAPGVRVPFELII